MEAPLSSECDCSQFGSTVILLSGALKVVHLLHFFSTVYLVKQKTMAQTFGHQVLRDGSFTLVLPSAEKLFAGSKSYWGFMAWSYLVLSTSASPQ